MDIIQTIKRFLGVEPPVLVDGHPVIAPPENAIYVNPYYIDPYNFHVPIRLANPDEPMVLDKIHQLTHEPVRTTPSSTSSFHSNDYFTIWSGTTENLVDSEPEIIPEDELLKYYLKIFFPWIIEVSEVRPYLTIKNKNKNLQSPLEIHITVSPIHSSELLNPKIEKKVREKLLKKLNPLIKSIYGNLNETRIIFSPEPSETILELI